MSQPRRAALIPAMATNLIDPRKQPALRSENVRSSAPQTRIVSRRAATKIAQSFA
jgi:hypothetical protein